MASGRARCSAVRQLPLRLTAGALSLNSGIAEFGADETAAERLQQFAAATHPLDPSRIKGPGQGCTWS
ncbi:hypothetical protein SLAV_01910 [Streptomyces lavendulae subsp. lavendulae]|uniref:Uncharacterized protein n=1 Tax=Streptomyces lavendulae subsp. lavendulae TaxID=58340 RepID=A0A2K8P6G5_STRLA|nr:hypothetical protein SLAV_01910 [Streptomyces lavendulae subsp. lavendulae]